VAIVFISGLADGFREAISLNKGEQRHHALTPLSIAYSEKSLRRFLTELRVFIRFPTVSAQPGHSGDLKRCAAWLANHLQRAGLRSVKIISTPRHPIVYADWLDAPGKPTVLIYGHYDVQPAEPFAEWRTPPFEPTVIGEDLFGRGACDNKGQMFAHVKAIEICLKTQGRLPVNVKCLFEGEEEIGSPNLKPFIEGNRRLLTADAAVMSDTRMLAADQPALTYALRGGLSFELEVIGQKSDLHSGNFGGAVHNPLQALCEIISKLHDSDRRIAIPGFYDRVRRWGDTERDFMAANGPSDQQILRDAKAKRAWGEHGYSLYELTTIRPSLSITGITGGYQGVGVKAVIPSRATAKLNFRLVPDQNPVEIEQLLRRHITRITPPTVRTTIRRFLAARPALIDLRHPVMLAAARAYEHGFGASPVFLRSGGTIPIVNHFQELLGVPTALMGFALPDDRIHAPNEKFHLPNFYRGIATCIRFLAEVGAKAKEICR
jgi:acetylornithine deacetylase/succinyl-diaminopimelate desuccinylase-like protein